MRSHVPIPDVGAPCRGIHGTGQEPLRMKNHLTEAHRDIEPQPYTVCQRVCQKFTVGRERNAPQSEAPPSCDSSLAGRVLSLEAQSLPGQKNRNSLPGLLSQNS